MELNPKNFNCFGPFFFNVLKWVYSPLAKVINSYWKTSSFGISIGIGMIFQYQFWYDSISKYQNYSNVAIGKTFFYWHERKAFQRSAFGRSTAGNYVVATIIISLFFFLFSPPFFFLLRGDLFSSKECLNQKLI